MNKYLTVSLKGSIIKTEHMFGKVGIAVMETKDKIIEIISHIEDENILEYLYVFIKGKVKAEE